MQQQSETNLWDDMDEDVLVDHRLETEDTGRILGIRDANLSPPTTPIRKKQKKYTWDQGYADFKKHIEITGQRVIMDNHPNSDLVCWRNRNQLQFSANHPTKGQKSRFDKGLPMPEPLTQSRLAKLQELGFRLNKQVTTWENNFDMLQQSRSIGWKIEKLRYAPNDGWKEGLQRKHSGTGRTKESNLNALVPNSDASQLAK